MSLDIDIKIDAPGAVSTIQGVEDALGKVETKGATAGEAASAGLKKATAAAEEASSGADVLNDAYGRLTSQFGEFGSIIDSITQKGALEGAAVAGLGLELMHISDEYTQLANNAQRFGDSYGSVNEAISAQLDLAGDLHGSLEQTMELSLSVKERTEDLGLSIQDQTQFTKELGEAVELSGKSLGSASEVINRLGFALDSGLPAGREMKTLFREFPALADALEDGLGKSAAQIVDMANKGKLSMGQFAIAIGNAGDVLDDKMSKRVETFSEKMGHAKDAANVFLGSVIEKASSAESSILGFLTGATAVSDAFADMKTSENYQRLLAKYPALFHDGQSAWESFQSGIAAGMREVQEKTELANSPLGQFFNKVNDLAKVMYGGQAVLDTYASKSTDLAKAVQDAQSAIKIAGAQGADSGELTYLQKNLAQAVQAQKDLTAPLKQNAAALSDLQKLYQSIENPITKHATDVANLETLYGSGRISVLSYEDELAKLAKTDPGFVALEAQIKRNVSAYDELAKAAAEYRAEAALGIASPGAAGFTGPQYGEQNRLAAADVKTQGGFDQDFSAKQDDEAKKYAAILESIATPASKFADELARIDQFKEALGPTEYAHAVSDLAEKFGSAVSPAEKLRKEFGELDAMKGAIGPQAYGQALQRLGKEQETLADSGKDSLSGLSRGWHSIRDEVNDTASSIASSMKGAFDEVNSDIISLVTTGSADWGKLLSTVEGDIAKLALQQGEKSLVNMFSSSASSSTAGLAAGTTTGTSAVATMLAGAPGIGAEIGAAFSAAAAAGSTASGAAPAGLAGLGGLGGPGGMSTGDTDLMVPGADAARLGGSSGLLPTVTNIPASQQRSANVNGTSGGRQKAPNVHVHLANNKRDLLSAVDSPDGHRKIVRVLREQSNTVRSILKR